MQLINMQYGTLIKTTRSGHDPKGFKLGLAKFKNLAWCGPVLGLGLLNKIDKHESNSALWLIWTSQEGFSLGLG